MPTIRQRWGVYATMVPAYRRVGYCVRSHPVLDKTVFTNQSDLQRSVLQYVELITSRR
jgi:hypothetical protein